ncbi:SDR family NAD(P)-dependent oxidoreductase [Kiritimatiellaeota bacterium B1221]|nr:SDR family NAD(P)-dependent oxidoreductase [Kiritimatiellaeota bacterium B1221]
MNSHLILFGASGGIASALRIRLEAKNWQITAVTTHPDQIREPGPNTLIFEADGSSEAGVKNAFAFAEENFGPPTAVINCLGSVVLKPIHRTSTAEFVNTMQLHVFSSFCILREACGKMKSGGSIALLSSVAVQTGLPNHESIAAAKGAVEGLTRSAAATYAPKGLRINAVAPGLTETAATATLCNGPARKISEKMHPLGRIGQPGDIASALDWLIDPEQSWVTGQILHLDGGLGQLRTLPKA